MGLIIPNVGLAVLADPATGLMRSAIDLIDTIVLAIDGKMTPVNAGTGTYPVVNIPADKAPKITASGVSLPLNAAKDFMGAVVTVAATGTPVVIPIIKEYTIGGAGTVALTDGDTISATNIALSVVGKLDGKPFTGAAASPTVGQFKTPIAADATLTFNVADAGKTIIAKYAIDSTSGGQVDIATTTISPVNQFVAHGKVINAADPTKALVPVTLVINACQFVGSWSVSMERQKASANSLELMILDPGGGKPAISIITAAKFAG